MKTAIKTRQGPTNFLSKSLCTMLLLLHSEALIAEKGDGGPTMGKGESEPVQIKRDSSLVSQLFS